MARVLVLVYGVVCYVVFLLTFLYAIAFVGNVKLGDLIPRTVDRGGPDAPLGTALLINMALLGLFGIQHSVMARPAFKARWTKIIPRPIERSTFVIITNAVLILMYWQWRPMTGDIWYLTNPVAQWILYGVSAAGWLLVLYATFLINHFDLFGLRQVWLYFQGKEYTNVRLAKPTLYRMVRHPLMLGFIIAFWSTPHMTTGHLVFAITTTAYILVAIQIEERDLVGQYGDDYREYRKQVGMIVPWPKRPAPPTAGA